MVTLHYLVVQLQVFPSKSQIYAYCMGNNVSYRTIKYLYRTHCSVSPTLTKTYILQRSIPCFYRRQFSQRFKSQHARLVALSINGEKVLFTVHASLTSFSLLKEAVESIDMLELISYFTPMTYRVTECSTKQCVGLTVCSS